LRLSVLKRIQFGTQEKPITTSSVHF
jgi:hypothetical protein